MGDCAARIRRHKEMRSRPSKVALQKLQNVLISLEANRGRIGVGLIESIQSSITDALDILQEGDPAVRRLMLCATVIVETTEIVESVVNGKTMQRVKVIDHIGYNWAISTIHKVAAGKA